MTALSQCVSGGIFLRAVSDFSVVTARQRQDALLMFSLDGDILHLGLLRSGPDRTGVSSISLVAQDKGAYRLPRQQGNIMPQLGELT